MHGIVKKKFNSFVAMNREIDQIWIGNIYIQVKPML